MLFRPHSTLWKERLCRGAARSHGGLHSKEMSDSSREDAAAPDGRHAKGEGDGSAACSGAGKGWNQLPSAHSPKGKSHAVFDGVPPPSAKPAQWTPTRLYLFGINLMDPWSRGDL